jgi:hypothetical protein
MFPNERFVNGMYNIAWIAGYMRDLETEGNKLQAFRIQQTNNLNHAIPVRLATPRPKAQYFDTIPISVETHLFGRRLENGERIVEARAIDIDAPSIKHLPGLDAWTKTLPPGAPTDTFRPNDGPSLERDRRPMNYVEIAGFVLAAAMARDEHGRVQQDCLIILIQQHEDETQALPVRLYGRFAAKCLSLVEPGQPLRIKGELRVRVKQVTPPEFDEHGNIVRLAEVVRYPYVHCADLKVTTLGEGMIRNMPEWAQDRLKRVLELRAAKASRRPPPDDAEIEKTSETPKNPPPSANDESAPPLPNVANAFKRLGGGLEP